MHVDIRKGVMPFVKSNLEESPLLLVLLSLLLTNTGDVADIVCLLVVVVPIINEFLTAAVLSQVLNTKQTAEVLVHCDPAATLVENLLDLVAQQFGFSTKQQIISNTPEGLNCTDWQRYWTYTQDVSPYESLRPEYIPVGASQRPAKAQLSLY